MKLSGFSEEEISDLQFAWYERFSEYNAAIVWCLKMGIQFQFKNKSNDT